MKNRNRGILSVVLVMASVLSMFFEVPVKISDARESTKAVATTNGEAEEAFVTALKSDMIDFYEEMTYDIDDFDGDGINDLFLATDMSAYIYSYKFGEIKQILKPFEVAYVLSYDKKKNIFWMRGEGDGGWVYAYKLKNNKLHFLYGYVCNYKGKKLVFTFKKKGQKAKKISKKKYNAARHYAGKWYKTITKEALIDELREIGGLNQGEPSTNPSIPVATDEVVYSTEASVVKDYGISGTVFHISLNSYDWGSPFFSMHIKDDSGWGEYMETELRHLEFELEDDFICTSASVGEVNKEYNKIISYDEFKDSINKIRKREGDEVGIDIFVKNGIIYRLGLVWS